MARDYLGSLLGSLNNGSTAATPSTGTTNATGTAYDTYTGTPRRGVPLAWVVNSFSAATAGTVATMTIQGSNDSTFASGVATLGTYLARTAATATTSFEDTLTISTQLRYVRALFTMASTNSPSISQYVNWSTANPT